MTLQAVLASILLLLGTGTFASCVTADHPRGPVEGGVVVETEDADYELVAKPDALRLYVRGHGTRIDLLGVDAKVALVTGKSKQVVALHPAFDRLEATGSFRVGPRTRAVAVVTRPSKPATTVRFTLN